MPRARLVAHPFCLASAVLAVALTAAPVVAQDEPRVLSARDTLRINSVGSPELSPDGEWVLYTVRSRNMDDPEVAATTQIWRVRVDGTDNHQLTYGDTDARSPAWSPDGRQIAFLAARGDAPEAKTHIHFIRAAGGEAWPVTEHDESITGFQFAPDGAKLLFMAPDPPTAEEQERLDRKDDAEVVDETHRMVHLWMHDLESDESSRLTEGAFSVSSPDWSPDSRWVVYERRPNPTANDAWQSDIWMVEVDTQTTRQLYVNAGTDTSPKWSPDGRTIAYASNPVAGSNTNHQDLHLISPEGGEPRVLVDDVDVDFSSPIWSADGRYVFWSVGSGTSTELFAVSVESGAVVSDRAPGGRNTSWELSEEGTRWVWVHTSADWPAEIYTATADRGEPLRLTDANAWLEDESVQLGAVRTVSWQNSDGETVEGVLTLPVGYEEGERYPFIVNPHGGPTGASLEAFNSSAQFFAGHGYVVLQPNFRGSTNYGQEFVNANIDAWGLTDYDDVMTGVDFAIDQGWADPERLICYGWSYGGYLSAWIVTQTDRFKAVSPGAALTNLYSMYSTNDIQDYLASFFGGTPWVATQNYRDHSPITFAADVTSPVLLLHGASDTRVPPEQSVEFYRALRDLGKDVTFVQYPREGHGISEPYHLMDRLHRYAEFFGKHVGNPPISEFTSDRIETEGGEIVITPIIHSSVQIEHDGLIIQIDPWTAGDLSDAKPADLILVTDDPGHHLDPEAIARLRKPGAPVVLTAAGHERFAEGEVLSNGERGTFAGVEVEAVPAYDMTPGQPFHPQGEANGYVITLGGKRIYFAGVTECVPEIQGLRNIDVAFMPMNLPVDRMRPIATAECVKTFNPEVVYLHHYDQPYARWLGDPQGEPPADAQNTPATIQAFRAAIEGEPIEFRDARWYPPRRGR